MAASSYAQGGDRVRALKVGFYTSQLQLTPAEAEKFWPLFNAMEDEQRKLRRDMRQEALEAGMNFENLADKDMEGLVNEYLNFRQKEVDLIRRYDAEFRKILPIRKVALLYRAELMFRREMLKQLQAGGGR